MSPRVMVEVAGDAAGVKVAATQAGTAIKSIGLSAEESAKLTVAASVKQRESLAALSVEYKKIGMAARAGSAEQVAATELALKANKRLGTSMAVLRGESEKSRASFLNLGKMMNVAFGGAILGLGIKSVTDSAMKFNSEMKLVHTQAGASTAEMNKMAKAVKGIAVSVGTGPEDLAKGLYHVESAGLRGAQALDVLTTAAKGAKVGHADLEAVTNALVAAQKSGISGVQNMNQAMGALNSIVGVGNMRMENLAEALSTGILPSARAVGLGLHDVGGALAVLTDAGVPAVAAATRLRMTFMQMAAPTNAAQKALKSIGLTSTDLGDTMRNKGLVPALMLLKTHLEAAGLSATQQTQIISKAFGGGRTSSTIITLLQQLDNVQKKVAAIDEGSSRFGEAWKSTQASAGFATAKFHAALQVLSIELGATLLPAVTKVANAIANWLDHAQKTGQLKALIDNVAAAVKLTFTAIGQLLGITNTLVQAMGGWKNVIIGVGIAFAAWKIGELVMSLAAVGKAVILLSTNFKAIGTTIKIQKAEVIGANVAMEASTVASAMAMKAALISTGFGALAVVAGLAAAYIITHWGQVKEWMGKFAVYMQATFHAGFQAVIEIAKGSIYVILNYATAGVRGVLEVASHLPFVGGKAKAALKDINDAINKFKPNFGNIGKAWDKQMEKMGQSSSKGGTDAGILWKAAFLEQINSIDVSAVASLTGATSAAGAGGVPASSVVKPKYGASPAATASWAAAQPGANTAAFGLFGEAKPHDCSAFVQAVFKNSGVSIGRDTYSQFARGKAVTKQDLQPNDLIFMNFPGEKSPGHVGIYIGGGYMVHDHGAHGGVQQQPVPWGNVVGYRRYIKGDMPSTTGGATDPNPTSTSTAAPPKPKGHKGPAAPSAITVESMRKDLGTLAQSLKLVASDLGDQLAGPIEKLRARVAELVNAAHPTSKQLADARKLLSEAKKELANAMKFDDIVDATQASIKRIKVVWNDGVIPAGALANLKKQVVAFDKMQRDFAKGGITDVELTLIKKRGKALQDTIANALKFDQFGRGAQLSIQALNKMIRDGFLTPADAAAARAQINDYNKTLRAAWADGAFSKADEKMMADRAKALNKVLTGFNKDLEAQGAVLQKATTDMRATIVAAAAGIGFNLSKIYTADDIRALDARFHSLTASLGKRMSAKDLKTVTAGLDDVNAQMKSALDQMKQQVDDAKVKVSQAWTDFGAEIASVFQSKVADKFKNGLDALSASFSTAELVQAIKEDTDKLAAAIVGYVAQTTDAAGNAISTLVAPDPEIVKLVNEQIALWQQYYADLQAGAFDAAKLLQSSIVANESALRKALGGLTGDQLTASQAVVDAGAALVGDLKTQGDAAVAQVQATWDTVGAEAISRINKVVADSQAALDKGAITLPQALQQIRNELVKEGMSPEDADKLIHDPLAQSLGKAVEAVTTATNLLIIAIDNIAIAMGIETPELKKAADAARDAIAPPIEEAATRVESAADRIRNAIKYMTDPAIIAAAGAAANAAAGPVTAAAASVHTSGFAQGGEVFRKQLAWIGEAGHEFIIPANKIPPSLRGTLEPLLRGIIAGRISPVASSAPILPSYGSSPVLRDSAGDTIIINIPNYVGDKRELTNVVRTEIQRTINRNRR